jgi:hypothetical protein
MGAGAASMPGDQGHQLVHSSLGGVGEGPRAEGVRDLVDALVDLVAVNVPQEQVACGGRGGGGRGGEVG